MTRRERMEQRAERRREWAEGRAKKAASAFSVGNEHRDSNGRLDWALVTQPGHIPERARINRAHERGFEHAKMEKHHEAKAAGIERQLETSIYSDDHNAAAECEAKASDLEAQADRAKAINAAFRKAPAEDKAAKLAALVESGAMTKAEALQAARLFGSCHWEKQPFPGYHMTNLRANARRYRQRAEDIRRQDKAQAEAEAAPNGVVINRHPDYDVCSVRFAEKPDRETLDALRGAGFHWGSGCWSGPTSKLPEAVAEKAQAQP